MQCSAIEIIENVTLQENQFHSQHLQIYEQRNECITPEVILHRNTGIPGDGNCLFHSLISVLQLQIETCELRNQLRGSPYLNSCHNPQEAYDILSSTDDYGDLDCLYLFSKVYNQNVCVHYCFFNITTKNQDTIFCHFKANDSQNWIHLHLCEQHFKPFHEVSDLLVTIQDATQNESHAENFEDHTEDNHNNYENEIEIDRKDGIDENILWKRDLKMSTSKDESILKPTLQANVENEPSENTDQQSEDLDFPNNLVSTSPGTVQPTLKRRRRAIETEDNQDFSTKGDDEECDLYGKILAKKLRRIPVWERQLLMYRIDGMIINTMEQNGLMPTETFHKGRTSHVSAQSLTEERLEEMLDGDSKAGITLYSDA